MEPMNPKNRKGVCQELCRLSQMQEQPQSFRRVQDAVIISAVAPTVGMWQGTLPSPGSRCGCVYSVSQCESLHPLTLAETASLIAIEVTTMSRASVSKIIMAFT